MGRRFELGSGNLNISVVSIDEGWELWLCEGQRRVRLAATVSLDASVEAGRQGTDLVLLTVERIRAEQAAWRSRRKAVL